MERIPKENSQKVPIRLDYCFSGLTGGEGALQARSESLHAQREALAQGTCAGSDFLGWLALPSVMLSELEDSMFDLAEQLRASCEAVVVIGIGGSYLGAKAIIDALPESANGPSVTFLGCNLCPDYLHNQLQTLIGRKVGVIVISKSGTTTEPALALRIFLDWAQAQGMEIGADRIVAITDAARGALHDEAKAQGWQMLVIPDNVGGRYSVLSPVGLLPLAVAGINIADLLSGAELCEQRYHDASSSEIVEAQLYAAWRIEQYERGRSVELLATYTPYMAGIAEWYKQLFAESEGKEGKGIFPISAIFTTDLHSLGQYFQQGLRLFFATHLQFENSQFEIAVPSRRADGDGLNYLKGRTLHEINKVAQRATQQAHLEGDLPSLGIWVPQRTPFNLGYLIYFFEYACALSCLAMGVNPFNQPGVEAYKRHMFEQLGKPGYIAK